MWQNYLSVTTVAEALRHLAERRERARIVAGATDLLIELERGVRRDIDVLVDITRVPALAQISLDAGGWIHLGPLVTHNAYDAHPWSSMLVGEGSLALRGALAPSSAARSGALTAAVPGCVGATSLVRAEGALDASDDVRALVRGARGAGRGQRWWCAML